MQASQQLPTWALTSSQPPSTHTLCSIRSNWEGIYVLYTYTARRQTARTVQLLLSNPEAGSEDTILRHITMCKY